MAGRTTRWRSIAVGGVGLTAALAVGVAAGLAWTQEPAPRGRGFGGPGGSPVFEALDTNHDGTVSADELATAAASLKALDGNGDGMLGQDELGPTFGRGGREGRGPLGRGRGDEPGETPPASADELASALMAFDANSDGTLTRAEVPERLQGLFDRADGDRNGVLTEAELKSSAASQAGPGAGGERGERGERGGFGGDGRRGRGPGGMRGDRLVAALDLNHDGTIGSDEIAGAAASLTALDANGDGQVSMDEVRPGPGREGRGPRP